MILKSAQNTRAFTQNILFTSAARTAWGHLLKHLNAHKKAKGLLPAYIGYTDREGSGVFDPVEETSIDYEFYQINEHLGFDLKTIEDFFVKGEITLLLVIHYFGFCRINMVDVAALCKKYEVILVEDCAHALQLGIDGERLGNKGDFSFYSLHKYLATTAGGILKINNSKYDLPSIPNGDRASLEILEQYIKTDLKKIAGIQRENYKKYSVLLSNVSEIEIMFSLSEGDVPHNFPIKVKHGKREALYFNLMNKGMPTIALYYRLIDQIQKAQFPVSFEIANEILNLPVHQDTTAEDIEQLCNAIKEYFEKEAV